MSDESKSAKPGFTTIAIHAGQDPDPRTGAVTVPISLATTFVQESPGVHKGFEYARTGNPTRQAFEACIAAVENGKYGFAFASGSSATATILHLLDAGSHVISVDDVYGGTQRYFRRIASLANNLTFSFIDFNVEGEFEKTITDKTKLVWLETPTNPTLKVRQQPNTSAPACLCSFRRHPPLTSPLALTLWFLSPPHASSPRTQISDIRKVAAICKAKGLLLVVDNTFMTPYFQKPLDLGADIVVHSITKYINGHSDVVGGVIATNSDELKVGRLRLLSTLLSPPLPPLPPPTPLLNPNPSAPPRPTADQVRVPAERTGRGALPLRLLPRNARHQDAVPPHGASRLERAGRRRVP